MIFVNVMKLIQGPAWGIKGHPKEAAPFMSHSEPTKLSFEFFPPRSLTASFQLWEAAQSLMPLAPEFVSVTYGAGGTTRDLTHDTVEALQSQGGARVAAHLTCVDASQEETFAVADRYAAAGVTDIVALRGDANGDFAPREDGFADSCALVSGLAARHGFNIYVGAYPDSHPEARDMSQNIDWLKAKIEAGACGAITQFFFEADSFFRFRDACADAGISAPIIPGILPIHNWARARSFAQRCGAVIPASLDAAFDKATRDGREDLLSIAQCTELCSALRDQDVAHLHFYTLNRPDLTRDVCRALGHVAQIPLEDVA